MEWRETLRKLNLSGVAISAALHADGSLHPVGGLTGKLLAAIREQTFPRIHTMLVADTQNLDGLGLVPAGQNSAIRQDPGDTFHIISADTLQAAAKLLDVDADARFGTNKIIDCTEELRFHQDFTGRNWLGQRLQTFLDQPSRGPARGKSYYLITGGPGAGKSAFVADCLRQADRPVYHFIKKGRGSWDDPAAIFRSLTAQLRLKYGLNGPASKDERPPADWREEVYRLSREFYEVLEVASRQDHGQTPLVVWLDGLDEAYGPTGQFAGMRLPGPLRERLPDGVCLVLTSRPGEHLKWLADPELCEVLRLEDETAANEADLRRYFEVQNRVHGLGLSDGFITEAVRRSENNFLFAVLLIKDLRALPPAQRTADRIPDGLHGWMVKQLEFVVDKWKEHNRGLLPTAARREVLQELGLLACAPEPLSLSHLTQFFGSAAADRTEDLLSLASDFFAARPADRAVEAPFHFFHTRFREFILEQVGDRIRDLQNRLTDACLGWRDFQGEARRYALRRASYHLRESSRWEDLKKLLTDWEFLEAKTLTGMVFELAQDFSDAVQAIPHEVRNLRLLEEALRREVHFIGRHVDDYPQALFQCLWNSCWWYDCDESAEHYVEPEGGWSRKNAPWLRPKEEKLCRLLELWRNQGDKGTPRFPWLRTLRPPPLTLGSPQLGVFRGHQDSVTSVAFSPDGRRIVSGADDRTVRLWDAYSGAELAVLRGHDVASGDPRNVSQVAFSPDGNRIAGVAYGTVHLWDAHTGAELAVLRHKALKLRIRQPRGSRCGVYAACRCSSGRAARSMCLSFFSPPFVRAYSARRSSSFSSVS